jgi:excisionase family DNA binding protein
MQGIGASRNVKSSKRNNLKMQSDSVLTLDPKGSTAITGFGLSHTYDLLRRGVMPAIVVGRRYYIPRTALLRWLDTCGAESKPAVKQLDPVPRVLTQAESRRHEVA